MTETIAGQIENVQTPGEAVQAFDFHLPRRITEAQIKTLRSIHEAFAMALGTMLTSRLQIPVTATATAVEQRFIDECLASLSPAACVHVFRIAEPGGSGALVMSPALALAMVTRLLGGPAATDHQERALTRIEQRVLVVIIERMLAELSTAWTLVGTLTCAPDRFETEPEFLQITAAGEIVLSVSLDLVTGEQHHALQFWLPASALEGLLERMTRRTRGIPPAGTGAPAWSEAVLQRLESIPVSVRCILGDASITLRELLKLAPGDVLRTSISVQDELHVQVGDRTRFQGRPGIANGRVALRITTIEPQAEQGA
jgi:flagellar motor switch protein FliM